MGKDGERVGGGGGEEGRTDARVTDVVEEKGLWRDRKSSGEEGENGGEKRERAVGPKGWFLLPVFIS